MPEPGQPLRSRPMSSCTFADLAADLVWPNLLRVGHFALRPARLGLSLVLVIGALALALIGGGIGHKGEPNPVLESTVLFGADLAAIPASGEAFGERAARQLASAFFGEPRWMIRHHPWVALILMPMLLVWVAVIGGAISRSAACDIGQGVAIGWTKALGFALERWRSLALALAMPLLIAWAITLGMAVAGWALFSLPVVNLAGAVAWPCFLLGGVAAATIVLGFSAGFPMLVPSVACEGTDAVDAVQHTYAFVFARPLRLGVYLLILLVEFLLLGVLVAVLWRLGIHIAHSAAGAWSGDRGAAVLALPTLEKPESLSGVSKLSRWIVLFCTGAASLVPLAFGVSYFWCGGTMLYLAMRRIVDGQDFSEVWMPGIVAGTQAAAAPIGGAGAGGAGAGESVSDSGPADAE